MRDGDPWFVAKDVCDCLELGNVCETFSRLDDERGIISNDTPSTCVISRTCQEGREVKRPQNFKKVERTS